MQQPVRVVQLPSSRAVPISETNFGAYDQDGPEARLPPWRRAARALLRTGLVALGAMLAGYGLFPL